jgi:myosin heavy subunit
VVQQVVYNVEGFCDKNKDLLFKDLIGLAECTSSTFFAVWPPSSLSLVHTAAGVSS